MAEALKQTQKQALRRSEPV